MAQGIATKRPAALAGHFYPADATDLRAAIAGYLRLAEAEGMQAEGPTPKAVIVPHAGYIYSGAIAAKGYERVARRAGIRRVVLLGPTHRVYVRGLAAPTTASFSTPLGDVTIDRAALEGLKDLPQIVFSDEVHALEHSLEVQLPFLQRVAPGAALVPLAVGDTHPQAVAEVLERFWDDPGTLIVISSDLSHFLPYADAKRRDEATAKCIENFAGASLTPDLACGSVGIAGLLAAAKRHGARIERVDLRNSGDTAGPKDRVVGYGAWAVYAKAVSDP